MPIALTPVAAPAAEVRDCTIGQILLPYADRAIFVLALNKVRRRGFMLAIYQRHLPHTLDCWVDYHAVISLLPPKGPTCGPSSSTGPRLRGERRARESLVRLNRAASQMAREFWLITHDGPLVRYSSIGFLLNFAALERTLYVAQSGRKDCRQAALQDLCSCRANGAGVNGAQL